MRSRRAIVLAATLVTACSPVASSAPAGEATVVSVVDGDTLVVRLAGADERVRLIGIDTPETKKPDTPVQCYGPEASARTAALLPPGTVVRLVRDIEARDRYDRLLAYVYRASDGLFVNLDLVVGGYARPLRFEPNTAHAGEIAAAADAARRTPTGLWAACPESG